MEYHEKYAIALTNSINFYSLIFGFHNILRLDAYQYSFVSIFIRSLTNPIDIFTE